PWSPTPEAWPLTPPSSLASVGSRAWSGSRERPSAWSTARSSPSTGAREPSVGRPGPDLGPQVRHPALRRLLGRVGLVADLAAPLAGRRVGTQDLHVGLRGPQGPQAVGHHLVGDVAGKLQQKAVVAERRLGRTAVQQRQVDGTSRELLEDRQQRTGPIGALVDDDRGL